MRTAINEIIETVLQLKSAKKESELQTIERHEHTNEAFQAFCNQHLLPILNETRLALLEHQIPAEVKSNPVIGFNQTDGIALIIATDEYRGANLLNSTKRVFILFELNLDEISLKVHVGGDLAISPNYQAFICPISENSLPSIQQLIQEVVREAATVYFKV
jgi:hypothetical protein